MCTSFFIRVSGTEAPEFLTERKERKCTSSLPERHHQTQDDEYNLFGRLQLYGQYEPVTGSLSATG